MSTETNKMMFSYGSVDLAYELKFFHTEKSIYTILKSNMNFNLKTDQLYHHLPLHRNRALQDRNLSPGLHLPVITQRINRTTSEGSASGSLFFID